MPEETSGVKGFLQTLRIVEREDLPSTQGAVNEQKATVATVPATSQVTQSQPVATSYVTKPAKPEVDQAMYNDIKTVVLATDTSFSRFLAALAKLEGVIPDEVMAYNAALKVSSQTPDDILKSFDAHMQVFEREKNKMERAITSRRESAVGDRQKSIIKNDSTMADLVKEVERIQGELDALKLKKSNIESEIASENAVIDSVAQKSDVVFGALKFDLETQYGKIQTYLKGAKA